MTQPFGFQSGAAQCASAIMLFAWASISAAQDSAVNHPLIEILQSELKLSMDGLRTADGVGPYFLQYAVTDEKEINVAATLGATTFAKSGHSRALDIDVRVGDYNLDNTRQIRSGGMFGGHDSGGGWTALPLNDDALSTRQAVWLSTNEEFIDAVERLAQVKANLKVKVEEEDPSDDFSREAPSIRVLHWAPAQFDQDDLVRRTRLWSARFRSDPKIYGSSVGIGGSVFNKIIVNSEGTRLQFARTWWRISVQASTIAEDGMELWQHSAFDAHSEAGLPDGKTIETAVDQVKADVLALREAPVVEPYSGPAILMNRATGVFFHEIFGHRIEGHRQKDVEEGQTFAKKIGKEVLPTFLSVLDDPTRRTFGEIELNGHYLFDDEGVATRPTRLVEDGVLRSFLLSRSPTRGFTNSTGHGRREPGNRVVSRQGNLIIESSRRVSFPELKTMLLDECRKQNKPYGLLFKDISGGFTTTQRGAPQAFKVLPILVYRVYVDGSPDELVRGVDIVGTPLTCFSRILAAADDDATFNGICGAESGRVPVSAIAPSVLVELIEVEKKQKSQDRPPILPAPIDSQGKGS